MFGLRKILPLAAALVPLAACVSIDGLSNAPDVATADSGDPRRDGGDGGGVSRADGGGDASGGGDGGPDGGTTFDLSSCVSGTDCVVAAGLAGFLTSLSASPDGKALYWAASTTPGVVHRYQTETGTRDTLTTKPGLVTNRVAGSDTGVYVISQGADRLRFRPLAGGLIDVTPDDRSIGVLHYSADLTALLWSEGTDCWVCTNPTTAGCAGGLGKEMEGVCDGSFVAGVASVRDYRAWLMNDGRVRALRGTVENLDSVVGGQGTAIGGASGAASTTDDEIFWGVATGGGPPSLRRISNGAPQGSAAAPPNGIGSIAANATQVFYTTVFPPDTFDVWQAPRGLGSLATPIAAGQHAGNGSIASLVVARQELYWTRFANGTWELVKRTK